MENHVGTIVTAVISIAAMVFAYKLLTHKTGDWDE